MKAVVSVKEYAQTLADMNKPIPWDVLDLTGRIGEHPKLIGALTVTNCSDHCQSFPLDDRTWYLWLSKSVAPEGSSWFCACVDGHVYDWRDMQENCWITTSRRKARCILCWSCEATCRVLPRRCLVGQSRWTLRRSTPLTMKDRRANHEISVKGSRRSRRRWQCNKESSETGLN